MKLSLSEEAIEKLKFLYVENLRDYEDCSKEIIEDCESVLKDKSNFNLVVACIDSAHDNLWSAERFESNMHLMKQVFEILDIKMTKDEIEEYKEKL